VKRWLFRLRVRWQARLEQPVRLDDFLHRNRLWLRCLALRPRRKPGREAELARLATEREMEKAQRAKQKAELAVMLEQLRARIDDSQPKTNH
jgi:hypothetical protein